MIEQKPLIIFDCDGVLVDSEPLANQVLSEAFREEGLEMDASAVMAAVKGLSMKDAQAYAEQQLGRVLDADFIDRVQEKTYAVFERDLTAIPGIQAALDELKLEGFELCVASSGSHEKMDITLGLTGLRGYFGSMVFSSSEVERGKPHPDLFLHVAEQMGYAPEDCIVVEDSPFGVQGAKAAGMDVLGYTAAGGEDQLKAAGAIIIHDMEEMLDILLGQE